MLNNSCTGSMDAGWNTLIAFFAGLAAFWIPPLVHAQTALGELEGRPAPVALRKCVSGGNAGNLCNQDGDCPSSSCADRNVFNLSVAVHFDAAAAQLTAIRNAVSQGSSMLFDVTDGQAEIGQATIHNNAFGTTDADLRIYPSTTPTWWWANTGSWKVGGSMHVSIDNVIAAGAVGETVAHEFLHLAFDPRDEYEDRPGCGAATSGGSCPIAAAVTAGATNCIMDQGGTGVDGNFSEMCWGQGNTANVNDFSSGDHDADNTTEQSQCRSNRSCWDQVVWSYPNTMLLPVGAPDPAANGAVVNLTQFTVTDDTIRAVLVLDESGSMNNETPTRMERLKVAAKDFVALAESGSELGIVAYATNTTDELAISALGNDRSAWNTLIDDLGPTSRTNISAGLDRARQLIVDAGGVTGNTFVVLMTDGLNNEPTPQATADAELQDSIDQLLADGIPVYVTCTGSDLGLQSQCSEIATGTGGYYVDSADASQLPLAFTDIAARGSGHEKIGEYNDARRIALLSALQNNTAGDAAPGPVAGDSAMNFAAATGVAAINDAAQYAPWLYDAGNNGFHLFYVEQGSTSGLFTLQWPETSGKLGAVVLGPNGVARDMLRMPLGLYAKVPDPEPGVWAIRIDGGSNLNYTARAYSQNAVYNISAGVRHASVLPGEPIYVFAYPRSAGLAISHPVRTIKALVTRPDGSAELLDLHDHGRNSMGSGDDVADDGIFTGVYTDTQQRGAYSISSFWAVNEWGLANDAVGHTHSPSIDPADDTYLSPALMREVTLTATVIDPVNDRERSPEDPPPAGGGGTDVDDFVWTIWILLIIAIILALFALIYCCSRRAKLATTTHSVGGQ